MKIFLMLTIFLVGLFAFACSPPVTDSPSKAQTSFVQAVDVGTPVIIIRAVDETTVPVAPAPATSVMNSVKSNVAELPQGSLAFLVIKVNLTTTVRDNKIFGPPNDFINRIVPNVKAGDGKFTKARPPLTDRLIC